MTAAAVTQVAGEGVSRRVPGAGGEAGAGGGRGGAGVAGGPCRRGLDACRSPTSLRRAGCRDVGARGRRGAGRGGGATRAAWTVPARRGAGLEI